MKRIFDLTLAVLLSIALLPIWVLIALAVVLDSKGGAIFTQPRVGKDGKLFTVFKFRSMVSGADTKGPYFTAVGDTRITRVGKFLRKTSLDELPQIFNVVKGDMSFVGPRPDTPAQKANYTDEQWKLRHVVRPGITGLAQATLRSAATEEQRLSLDLAYVKTHSFSGDLKILFMTFRQVVGRGGY